ncbi:MAG: MBL fold metallo-hydrolase [Planctomycetota bacterium]
MGTAARAQVSLVVLGIAQDGGYPQAACERDCCALVAEDPSRVRLVSCLAIIDHATGDRWLIDATPDLPEQLRLLDSVASPRPAGAPVVSGIFLTHAHIGHYTGLAQLGREVIGTNGIPAFAMPRMGEFLRGSGPWSQLVKLENIDVRPLADNTAVGLGGGLSITPLLVPHRDEFSETVGFRIDGPTRSALFIPDIDKWSKWDRSLADELASVDVAYLDGTFFRDGEIPGRDMSLIPHPFVEETVALLRDLHLNERAKVRFIHLNHTNPLLWDDDARREIEALGFRVAEQGEIIQLGEADR